MEQPKTNLKLTMLLMAIAFMAVSCQKDDAFTKDEQNTQALVPTIKTISYSQAGATFNRLKNDLQIEPYLKTPLSQNMQARNSMDTLGFTVYTDVIKQVTLGDYISYTMLIANPQADSTKFYNLTIEDKNGTAYMFITKYTPTEEWRNDTNTAYRGGITTFKGNNVFQQYEEDNSAVGGGGSGSNNPYNDYSTPQGGSPYYPTDCQGTVVITTQPVPYPCGCGDWPGEPCGGCDISPQYPGYNNVPYFYCLEDTTGWPNTNPGNDPGNDPPYYPGGNDPGNGSAPSDNYDNSLAGLVNPDEVCNIPGDLDGNCIVDPKELLCMEIKKQITNSEYIQKKNYLETQFSAPTESGFSYKGNGTYVNLNNVSSDGHSLDIEITSDMLGYMHTHLNDKNIPDRNGDGVDDVENRIRMFSPRDLRTFLRLLKNAQSNNINAVNIFATMASSSGTYTLRFEGDINDVINNLTPSLFGELASEPARKDFEKLIKKYGNERGFLKFLKQKTGTINGINLYRIRNNGSVEQKYLDENEKVKTSRCD